jgi:hypothetical protein
MSNEFSTAEKVVEEFFINLETERVMSMSTSIQASSKIMIQASPSNARGAKPSRPLVEKKTKHKDDLENVKLIPTIFLDYILPLDGMVNRDSIPRDFEYTMVTAYLSKGIHIV